MRYEDYDTAGRAIDRVSRGEEAAFERKYSEISEILDGTKIAIEDFQANPEGVKDFILNDKEFDGEMNRMAYRSFATPAERMASDLRMERYFREEVKAGKSESRAASALEYIFGIGVKMGNWLGVEAESRAASTFDDVRYKIDEIVTIADEDDSVLPFGVDVTIGTSAVEMAEKLGRSHNNEFIQLPEGCSRVIYYEYGGERRSLPVVPRYVVALQASFVEAIVRTDVRMDAEGNMGMSPNARRMLVVRERILSELYAQADMRLRCLQMIAPEAMTDDEADAFDAIAAQRDIFDTALTKVGAAMAVGAASLKGLKSWQVREILKERSMEDDKSYATLMREIERMNCEVAGRKIGAQTVSVARELT